MSYLLLIPSTLLLILGIRFFISRLWFESFSKSFICLFSMSVLSFTFNIWNIVIIIILKSLSTNSYIYVFLVLSIDWYFSFEWSFFFFGCLVTFYWMPGLVNFTLVVLDIFIFLSLFLCLGTQCSYLGAFDPLKAFLVSRQSRSLILWLIFPPLLRQSPSRCFTWCLIHSKVFPDWLVEIRTLLGPGTAPGVVLPLPMLLFLASGSLHALIRTGVKTESNSLQTPGALSLQLSFLCKSLLCYSVLLIFLISLSWILNSVSSSRETTEVYFRFSSLTCNLGTLSRQRWSLSICFPQPQELLSYTACPITSLYSVSENYYLCCLIL